MCRVTLIEAADLRRVFRRPDKGPGLKGSLRHLVERRYTEKVAVDGIDLQVGSGEAVAYVGPNGAGKSTTVKLLTGILVPTSGEVRVDGLVPHRNRIENARRVGVVFGQRTQLWWDLPVRDSLELLRDMHGVGQVEYAATLERLVDTLDIADLLSSTARTLSLGQRMRADLAAALIHSPRIVYLDEPTIGLDLTVKDRRRAFVKQLVAEGATVMLTTHDLGDIEDICRRMVDHRQGAHRPRRRPQRRHGHVRPRAHPALHARCATHVVVGRRGPAPGGDRHRGQQRPRAHRPVDPRVVTAGDVLTSVQSEAAVVDLRIDEPAIEDVVRKIYAGQLEAPGREPSS